MVRLVVRGIVMVKWGGMVRLVAGGLVVKGVVMVGLVVGDG